MWKSRPAQERTCEADWMCVLACSQLKKTSIGCRRALVRVDTAADRGLFPLSRRDERDVPLGLQMGSPFCVDIGTICIEPAVCDRCAVQIDLLCSPQVAETGFADLYGAGDGKLMRAQLGKNMQLDAVIPQVLRGISC